jgi:BirA family transcriptional regulator, biotin operon repressor / biotin---[acetyl-CoA-carboxylase] ligase
MFTGVPADHASTGPLGGSAPKPPFGPSSRPRRPDPAVLAAEASGKLRAGSRFRALLWLGETASTNDDAMGLARDGAPEGAVVLADHQTAGRGRRQRRWVAPPGSGLLVSVLLRPPAELASSVGMLAGVAMAEAVKAVAGVTPGLKWPNDLVWAEDDGRGDRRERKLAGILCEADWPPGSTASGGWRSPYPAERVAVVAGVGINVTWPPGASTDGVGAGGGDAGAAGELPPEVADTATSLHRITGRTIDRVDLLVAYLDHLDALYGEVIEDGPVALQDRWRRRTTTLDRRVRVQLGGHEVDGTAVDITAEGHLVLETEAGDRRTFAVGDVVHLR